jgi:hypothetical protein
VLNLQKSQYDLSYYVNVALWLLAVGDAGTPKPQHCHIQTRLGHLLPPELEARVPELFSLATDIDETVRRAQILDILATAIRPIAEAVTTLDGLVSGAGLNFVRASLITGEGQQVLRARGVQL